MRRSVVLVAVVLGSVVMTAPAKTKKPVGLSQLFCHAQFVFADTYEGAPDARLQQMYPLDYDAAVGVQQLIERWNRYKVVYEEDQADLVFMVWRARPEGNRLPGEPTQMPPMRPPQTQDPGMGPGAGQNPQGAPGRNPGMGPGGDAAAQTRPAIADYPWKDELAVYQPQNAESMVSPLWKKQDKDGLKAPNMTLFGGLADAVDDACANAPGS